MIDDTDSAWYYRKAYNALNVLMLVKIRLIRLEMTDSFYEEIDVRPRDGCRLVVPQLSRVLVVRRRHRPVRKSRHFTQTMNDTLRA